MEKLIPQKAREFVTEKQESFRRFLKEQKKEMEKQAKKNKETGYQASGRISW